jgi:hypothetical protein
MTATVSTAAKPRHRLWHRVARVGVLVAAGAALAYVTLPWWAPVDTLRRYMVQRLSARIGAQVQVGGLNLTWHGAELTDLVIAQPAGFEGGRMVTVGKVRAELSPLKLLLNHPLEWSRLEDVKLDVRADEDGELNIAGLLKADLGPSPTLTSICRAEVTLHLPQGHAAVTMPGSAPAAMENLVVNVNDAQLVAGKLDRVERVTLSAGLMQDGASVPISLHLGPSAQPSLLASAALSFHDLRLDSLDLPRLLGLPLERLGGRCGGTVKLNLSNQYVVDSFHLELTAAQLDAQPLGGPRAPVIERAAVVLDGRCDPVLGELVLSNVQARLPGLDLKGSAVVVADFGSLRVQRLRSVEVGARVWPQELWALAGQKGPLPGGLELAEALSVLLELHQHEGHVDIDVQADATDLDMRRQGAVIKPVGRKLCAALKARLDDDETFHVETLSVDVGANSFGGNGTLLELMRQVRRWNSVSSQAELQSVLGELARLDWQGHWTIGDLDSLRDLAPADGKWAQFRRDLDDVRIMGTLEGRWGVLTRGGRTTLAFDLSMPEDSELEALSLRKPRGRGLELHASTQLDPVNMALENAELAMSLGQAQLRLDGGHVQLGVAGAAPGGEAALTVDAGGQLLLDHFEDLLDDSPVAGMVRGQWTFQLGPDARRLHVQADLARASLLRFVLKPLGQSLTVELDSLTEGHGADAVTRATMLARLSQAHARLDALIPHSPDERRQIEAHLACDVTDARWLARACPALADALNGGQLGGGLSVAAGVRWRPRELQTDLRINADNLEFSLAQQPGRRKPAGVPLRLRAIAGLQTNGGLLQIDASRLALDAGASRAWASGRFVVDTRAPSCRLWPLAALKQADGSITLKAAIDQALTDLVPELRQHVDAHRLSGRCDIEAKIKAGDEGMNLDCSVVADELAALWVGPLSLPYTDEQGRPAELMIDPLTKPKHLPAGLRVEISLPPDLSRVQLSNLELAAGPVGLLADGRLSFTLDADSLPKAPADASAHVALWASDASKLAQLAPALAKLDLRGACALEFEAARAAGQDRLKYVNFIAKDLRAAINGKNVRLSGDVLAESVKLTGPLSIGRLRSDGIEFAVGDNSGWAVIDVADLPARAKGMLDGGVGAHLVVNRLDDRDLASWLAGAEPADERASLTLEQTKALRSDAAAVVARARSLLRDADVGVRLWIDRLVTFDHNVRKPYELQWVEAQLALRHGHIGVTFGGGLNGGSYRTEAQGQLGDASSVLEYTTTLQGVRASVEVQAQISRVFPGNTLYGSLEQTEWRSARLGELAAAMMDNRYQPVIAGSARTVATEGLLEGRAAPYVVTAVFPDLNLTKYQYTRMTGFADYLPDGSAVNDMLFDGRSYDIYIHGRTEPDGRASYDVGLLLSPLSHEAAHADGLVGRIPIFTNKARIVGGQMQEQEISYTPRTVRDLLLHPVYIAWRTAQRLGS